MPSQVQRNKLDEIFKALASERRREILRILGASTPEPGKTCCGPDEICACKLSDRFGLAPSTISHHMSILCESGLVSARKDGLWTYYTLRRDALEEAVVELKQL